MKQHVMRILVIGILLLAAVALMGFAPFQGETPPDPGGDPVTVPAEVQVFLNGAVIFIVTAGIKALSQAFPKIPNLQNEATVFAGAVVTFIIAVANALLTLIPPEYQPFAIAAFIGIGGWLAANGYALIVKGFQKKAQATSTEPQG